ncbi:MAG: Phosphoribosylaminoimidazole-succinocarboxamide synthase [Phycisphaerae bacterium]|nr:Phosphoribosylaminoimidazole-succinocarboxamide synthase [Phycisphaerae bacterium]
MNTPVMKTELPLPVRRGKVRDVYELDDERLLLVATDRISAFDVIMPNGIPDKGVLLTQISLFWFRQLDGLVPNHILTDDVTTEASLRPYAAQLAGRSVICRKAPTIPIECVVRGYLAGSGWKEYQGNGAVCGVKLPAGLRQCAKLPQPIFTPATKAESGHDLNIDIERTASIIGKQRALELRKLSLELYTQAADYAAERGIIIADTKFEFGVTAEGELLWIDEALTPDSSRFWPAKSYQSGRDQESFDKQYVRNYLETLDWNKTPPGPTLPPEVMQNTRAKYVEAFERLTGRKFE